MALADGNKWSAKRLASFQYLINGAICVIVIGRPRRDVAASCGNVFIW